MATEADSIPLGGDIPEPFLARIAYDASKKQILGQSNCVRSSHLVQKSLHKREESVAQAGREWLMTMLPSD
jgi:hypothetical protein